MSRRKPWSTRFAVSFGVWLAVCTLLLKAAVPMLASASAQAQGKTLVEVCTVYGVATVALEGADDAPASDHALVTHSDHCALNALAALAVPDALTPLALRLSTQTAATPPPPLASTAPDACARWVARLKHGPPAFA